MTCLVNPRKINGFTIGFDLDSGMMYQDDFEWPGYKVVEEACASNPDGSEEFWGKFWDRYMARNRAASDKARQKWIELYDLPRLITPPLPVYWWRRGKSWLTARTRRFKVT